MKTNIDKLEDEEVEIDRLIAEMEKRTSDMELRVMEHKTKYVRMVEKKADRLGIPVSEVIECIFLWGWATTLKAIDVINKAEDLRIACYVLYRKEN